MLHADLSKSTLDLTMPDTGNGSQPMRRRSTVLDLETLNADQDVSARRESLAKLGGLNALEKSLNTSFKNGLNSNEEEIRARKESYGVNFIPEPEPKTWLGIFLGSFEDTTLIILIVAAIVSLIVGTYDDPAKGWIEGAAILFAVLVVACVTATNDYNKDAQFRSLNAVKDDVSVTVIRDGSTQTISIKEILVGDIVQLSTGMHLYLFVETRPYPLRSSFR